MEAITFGNELLPARIKVDKGSAFISKVLDKWTYKSKVELDFSRPGKSADNFYRKFQWII
tara:strand:- start:16596 stop:16775 length:180 start_codon:yes stop_codon:yes gene_type:complete